MSIPELVQRIVDGHDVVVDVALLQPYGREAVRYMVSVFAGETPLIPAPGVHPHDAEEALLFALASVAKGDVEYLISLQRAALAEGAPTANDPAFALTWALAHVDNPATLGALADAMRNRDWHIRWAACVGLRRLRVPAALQPLNRAVLDRSSDVRIEAIEALEEQGNASSIPFLKRRVRDRYSTISTAAQKAIETIEARAAGGRPNGSS